MSDSEATSDHDVLLAIESTCDETAAAVVTRSGEVLGQCVATQDKLHERFGGVVPEIAARAHLERVLPVIDQTLTDSRVAAERLAAIAVADRPGLAGSLLVGVVAAKMLALVWQKPLVAINHLQAHLHACRWCTDAPDEMYPAVGLIVSGGHTSLYRCNSPIDLQYLGGTIDDAAGEAFDKVGAMLGLGFPGGVAVSRLAAQGDPQTFGYPRPKLRDDDFDFSFSGLKTAVRYSLTGPGRHPLEPDQLSAETKANVCASFEAAIVDVLTAKCRRAILTTDCQVLLIGGGVAANPALRRSLQQAAETDGFQLLIAPPELCTDNAVMGALAWHHLDRGETASLDLDITAGLQRGY
ncbi:MAG: tRNA (adenosine(37)-N6)-threonylcarbamoyltransferase complex transferase subunit TsaD [Planctomycetota bacterium]